MSLALPDFGSSPPKPTRLVTQLAGANLLFTPPPIGIGTPAFGHPSDASPVNSTTTPGLGRLPRTLQPVGTMPGMFGTMPVGLNTPSSFPGLLKNDTASENLGVSSTTQEKQLNTTFGPAPMFHQESSSPKFSLKADLKLKEAHTLNFDMVKSESTSQKPIHMEQPQKLGTHLVEQGLNSSLPQVVKEVAEKQKYQTEELQRHQRSLNLAKEKLEAELQKVEEAKEELASIHRKINLAEEQCATQSATCSKFQREIDGLIQANCHKKAQLGMQNEEVAAQQKLFRRYQDTMNTHKHLVDSMEKDHLLMQQLTTQRQTVQNLQNNKKELERKWADLNNQPDDLQKEVTELESQERQLKEGVTEKQNQINKLKAEQKKVQMDVSILQKKTSAQMNRLKRQVKEMQTRNRQYEQQASQLQDRVNALSEQLTGHQ